MRFREFDGIVSKADKFTIDPRTVKVRPGFNVRDLSTPDARAKLDILKAQIKSQGGVKKSLLIEWDGETPYLVDGHRRLTAVMELIAEGEDIRAIPAEQEEKGTNDANRVVAMLTAPGEPLAPLEIADGIKRLIGYGWDKNQIAAQLGFKSVKSVADHLDMLAMPEAVQQMVKAGEVSGTTAVAQVRKKGAEKATEDLTKARDEAKADGKTRVMPKRLREPKAEPERKVYGSTTVGGELHIGAQVHDPREPDQMPIIGTAPTESPTTALLQEGIGSDITITVIPDGQPTGMDMIVEALRPFARFAFDHVLTEFEDDHQLGVQVMDLKRAATVFAKITGGMEP